MVNVAKVMRNLPHASTPPGVRTFGLRRVRRRARKSLMESSNRLLASQLEQAAKALAALAKRINELEDAERRKSAWAHLKDAANVAFKRMFQRKAAAR